MRCSRSAYSALHNSVNMPIFFDRRLFTYNGKGPITHPPPLVTRHDAAESHQSRAWGDFLQLCRWARGGLERLRLS